MFLKGEIPAEHVTKALVSPTLKNSQAVHCSCQKLVGSPELELVYSNSTLLLFNLHISMKIGSTVQLQSGKLLWWCSKI